MIEKIFLQTFIVFAVWASMWEGMIFGFVRDKLSTLPEKLKMPLYDCPICQNSIYGSLFYWLYYGNSFQEYIVVLIGAVGLSAIFVKLFPPDEN